MLVSHRRAGLMTILAAVGRMDASAMHVCFPLDMAGVVK